MSEKYILFVDDKSSEQRAFKKALDRWNAASPERTFVSETAENVADALEQLRRHRFDAALFDLKLPSGSGGPGDGNDLVESGLMDYGIPVGIISGHSEDIEPTLRRIQMLRTFDKLDEDAFDQALTWLGEQWEMMDVLRESRGQIRRSGAAIFANRVWPNWQNYQQVREADEAGLIRVVARQYAAHIAEHLGVDDALGWHPFEHYIQPSMIENRAQTGDIFRIEDELWVLLTPACDLATKKAKVVLLAHCRSEITSPQDPLANWDNKVVDLSNGSLNRDERIARDRYFSDLVNQNHSGKHFLPPLAGGRPMFVEFKALKTVASDQLRLDDRVASVAPAFLSNLVQRFGAYLSRTGQPNIEIRHFG